MQEDIDVGEEVVAHLRGAHDIEASLVVMANLMRRSPDGTAACSKCIIVHHRRDGAIAVVGAVSGGIHIAVRDGEGIPDVAETSLQVFLEAHEVLFALDKVVPDTHQAFHFTSLADGILHQITNHGEDEAVALQVDDVALVEHLLIEERPVLIGHTACVVKVALQLTSLDVYLGSRIVGKILLGVAELVEDVECAGLTHQDDIESGM